MCFKISDTSAVDLAGELVEGLDESVETVFVCIRMPFPAVREDTFAGIAVKDFEDTQFLAFRHWE